MVETVKQYLTRDAARRAYRTFLQAFFPLFILSITGWLNDLLAWASEGEAFPPTKPLLLTLAAAVISGLIAVCSYVQNLWEGRGTTDREWFVG